MRRAELCRKGLTDDDFYRAATRQLHDQFGIHHVTLQVVREPFSAPCE